MQILTETEGSILNASRRVLLDLAKRVQDQTDIVDAWELREAGKITMMLEQAEDAIFDALNVLSSHGDDKIADKYAVYVGRTEHESKEGVL